MSQVKSVFRLLSANDNTSVEFAGGPVTQGDFTGSAGDDVLVGTSGDDTMSGLGGSDVLIGAGGNDALDGGGGNDTASFEDQTGDVTASLVDGTATTATGISTLVSIENLTGGSGDDFLAGGAGVNIVSGGAGDDKLNGGDGADILNGGIGNDNLIGVNGSDTLHGEDGDDSIKGGKGDDIIDGGSGVDTANYAGAKSAVTASLLTNIASGSDSGNDTLIAIENLSGSDKADTLTGDNNANALDGNDGNDVLDGQGGSDSLRGGNGSDTLSGGDGDDVLRGGKDPDILNGGTGNDLFLAAGTDGSGGDTMNGDAGVDTVDYSADTAGVKADLLAGTAKGDNIGKDTLSSIENVVGGTGDDQLTGDGSDNALTGNDGNDTLTGDSGHDVLDGGAGNDIIDGGNGDDVLIGGAGIDSLNGGGGIDTVDYSSDFSNVTADIASQSGTSISSGTDSFSGIENIIGGHGNDKLTGDGADNALSGLSGNDRIFGGAGVDNIDGGAGDDIASGEDGDDVIAGGDGNDTLSGEGGNDTIVGGSGNDTISDGSGDDALAGGDGDDTFLIGGGSDSVDGGAGFNIADFSALSGGIVVDSSSNTITGSAVGSYTVTNIQSVIGTTGNDTFISGNGIKEFWGSGGNDTLIGSVPSGIFFRGTFADYSSVTISLLVGFDVRAFVDGALIIDDVRVSKILLGSGDDLVRAPAFQTVDAGEGDDIVEGAPGHNILNGGAGNDTIDYSLQRSSLSVDLSTGKADGAKPMGNDDLNGFENAYAGSGDDTLIGDAIANVLRGGDGQDMLSGGAGNDTIEGGSGYDTVSFASEASPVVVDLAAGIADGASSGHDVLVGVEFAIGTTGDDHLTGTDAGYSKLDGGDGNDVLVARFYSDLFGGAGDDTLVGGIGQIFNQISGGGGIDTVDYSAETHSVDANLATGTLGGDALLSIENLITGSADDSLTGSNAANVLTGNAGNDTLSGGGGNDTLLGGVGSDGLTGGAGADLIDGGNGADILIYSSVADSTGALYDTLNGFDSDEDHIDTAASISAVDAWVKTGALSTASFDTDLAAAVNPATLGANHAVLFTADAGTLSGHTFLVVDSNGMAGYQAGLDLVMELTNGAHLKALAASDFI